MKKFTVPVRDLVSPENQAHFDNLNKALGFVPNLYATIANSKTGLTRYLNYQNAKSSLSNKEKEAINLLVSEINGCEYCKAAHTVIGKMNQFTDEQLIQIRLGKSQDPKLNALLALTADITRNKGRVNDALLEDFFANGYNNESLVDLVLQISEKIAMNYLHNITQVPVDFPAAPVIGL